MFRFWLETMKAYRKYATDFPFNGQITAGSNSNYVIWVKALDPVNTVVLGCGSFILLPSDSVSYRDSLIRYSWATDSGNIIHLRL